MTAEAEAGAVERHALRALLRQADAVLDQAMDDPATLVSHKGRACTVENCWVTKANQVRRAIRSVLSPDEFVRKKGND